MTYPGRFHAGPVRGWLLAITFLIAAFCAPSVAQGHFSQSDPRIIHIVEQDDGAVAILMRMPAPLALLPDDWQGSAERRRPPFASVVAGSAVLDPATLDNAGLRETLRRSLNVQSGGRSLAPRVQGYRFRSDDDRPRFGTVKTATAALQSPATDAPLAYFDATLDVILSIPADSLTRDLRLTSGLGENFRILETYGTVVKLHRAGRTETRAVIGVLDVSFPAVTTRAEILRDAALGGAEHIYRGLDHLAIIVLIAVAASGWRQALTWASAFTFGHVVTLAAGLYGIAPSAAWFVPLVELAIVLSIVFAGLAVVLRADRSLGWIGLLIVGLIHGYGFAASASVSLFAGDFDAVVLLAFAAGLELCQFALYALALPLVLMIDRYLPARTMAWRRAAALAIALFAVSSTLPRLTEATAAFAVA